MVILVNLEASEFVRTHRFTLEELNLTEEEWCGLSEQEKHDVVEKVVLELNDQPYWMVDSFKVRKK